MNNDITQDTTNSPKAAGSIVLGANSADVTQTMNSPKSVSQAPGV